MGCHRPTQKTIVHLIQNRCEHRKWLEAVFLMIKFLIKNGLPLPGNEEATDSDEGVCDGLNLNIMNNLVFELRPDLAEITKKLPKNAKYTSPTIQNEVISVLKDIVQEKIAAEIREGELFTLMVEGSTDKNNNEIVSIVYRYIVEGTTTDEIKVVEHVVHMENLPDRSAQGVFALVKCSLDELEISLNGLVSQCYDGISVMYGERAGLQKLISDFCKRSIVYIHCFCHRLHLVFVVVLEDIQQVKKYFPTAIYNFFQKRDIRQLYNEINCNA